MTIRIGRVEWIFLSLLAVYLLRGVLRIPISLQLLISAAMLVTGTWSFVRVARSTVRHLLWRLRNRLIVAYVFIALVPVVLITMLVGIGGYLTGGQLTIWFVMSELERRTAALASTVEYLARESPGERQTWVQNVAPFVSTRFPGLQLIIDDNRRWTYPPDAQIQSPPAGWNPGSGLLIRDGSLYGWAYTNDNNRRVMGLFPISRELLGQLAPDITESAILDLRSDRVLLHPGPPSGSESHNRLPPAVNRFDFEIRWGAPLPVQSWEKPAEVINEWITVRTRPSAIFRTVFHQKVDWATEFVPMLFFTVAVGFLIAEVVALFIGISITRTVTRAVHDLYESTLRIRSGDFSHRIPIRGSDQLAELSVSFNQMTENVRRLLSIEKERERLQAELEIAREVQNQLYPKKVPEVESLALTAVCNPARMVSGDYYDYQQLGSDKVAIAIGDVAGKGISAALLMATVQSSFRSQIRGSLEIAVAAPEARARIQVSTSHLVSQLNQQLYADTSPEKYATFYLGVYDVDSSTLTYTNAGHLPPVLVRNGVASRLEVNGMVVGAFPFARYGESQVVLHSGDLIVFFTDGMTEPENEYGEMFGEDRLVDIVVRNAHRSDREIIESIMEAVHEWTGAGELQDDMTLLVLRRKA